MIIIRALWSLVAWTLAFGTMALVFVCALPFLPFVSFARIQRRGIAQVLGLIPHYTLSRMTITYDPAFDKDRVSVFTQNHISMLDAHVAIAAIPSVFCGMENAAHFNVPFYGWLMKLASGIPVPPRGSEGRSEALTVELKERASRGISILAFPEGTRTTTGDPGPFRRGVFFMARNAGLPIVPLAVRGFYEVLSKGTWIVKPGHIEVYVGPQIETEGLSDEEVEALAERTHEIIQAWIDLRQMV